MLYIRLFLSIISLFFTGYPFIHYLLVKKSEGPEFKSCTGKVYIFFLSFYTGLFFASIYLMVLSIASVRFSLVNISIFSGVFFIFSAYLIFKNQRRIRRPGHTGSVPESESGADSRSTGCKINAEIKKPSKICAFLYGLFANKKLLNAVFAFIVFIIAVDFFIVAFFTFLFPIRFWDAISCWSLKGRAFFIDSSVLPFFTDHDYNFAHLSYPLYLPLAQTWIYIWLGLIDETLVKIIFPLFYLSIIFIFYFIFRRKFNRLFSIVVVFIFSTLPVVMDHGYIEYSNLVFSIILFLGVYYLYRYSKNKIKQANLLILATIFFAALSHIRTEGIFFLLLFLIINTILSLKDIFTVRRPGKDGMVTLKAKRALYTGSILRITSPAVLVLFLLLPWLYIKTVLGLDLFSSEWGVALSGIRQGAENYSGMAGISGAAKSMFSGFLYSAFDSVRAFLGASYGPVWFVLFMIFLINIKRSILRYSWIFLVFILAGFISLFISFSLIEEFIWSTDRYLLHFLPLTYFWIFYNLPLFKDRKEL